MKTRNLRRIELPRRPRETASRGLLLIHDDEEDGGRWRAFSLAAPCASLVIHVGAAPLWFMCSQVRYQRGSGQDVQGSQADHHVTTALRRRYALRRGQVWWGGFSPVILLGRMRLLAVPCSYDAMR